ncbi:hypothetical protein IU427_20320 [Nocardia beijingensis]|uniref:hypothetical protein n=1 Tax=Nocardia beijingensis TaxID=95162 RepID=UPI001893A17B|nr:hypothetical protein [Nocardia beijingensis]MBF6467512.1 hypothetical protein [Nocardia beijingensis]
MDRIVTPVSPFGDQADGHAVRWAKENQLIQSGNAERRLARTRPGTLADPDNMFRYNKNIRPAGLHAAPGAHE